MRNMAYSSTLTRILFPNQVLNQSVSDRQTYEKDVYKVLYAKVQPPTEPAASLPSKFCWQDHSLPLQVCCSICTTTR